MAEHIILTVLGFVAVCELLWAIRSAGVLGAALLLGFTFAVALVAVNRGKR